MFFNNSNKIYFARVSDLFRAGFRADYLAREFVRINQEVWGVITDSEYVWTVEKVKSHFAICPDLHYCAFVGSRMVATLTNMFTTEEELQKRKTWLKKTDNGYLTSHMPDGQVAFGVDLSVAAKNEGIGNKMVEYAILVTLIGEGRKAVYLGARIPGYHKHQNMTVDEYISAKRADGKALDPQMRFYLSNGFKIIEAIPGYMDDPESLDYGVLIKWDNPLYLVTRAFPFLKKVIQFFGKSLFLGIPPRSKISPKGIKGTAHVAQ